MCSRLMKGHQGKADWHEEVGKMALWSMDVRPGWTASFVYVGWSRILVKKAKTDGRIRR